MGKRSKDPLAGPAWRGGDPGLRLAAVGCSAACVHPAPHFCLRKECGSTLWTPPQHPPPVHLAGCLVSATEGQRIALVLGTVPSEDRGTKAAVMVSEGGGIGSTVASQPLMQAGPSTLGLWPHQEVVGWEGLWACVLVRPELRWQVAVGTRAGLWGHESEHVGSW